MGLSELSFSATNINVGLAADEPLNPRAGDLYLQRDKQVLRLCFVNGTWVDANPNPEIRRRLKYVDDTQYLFNDPTRATAYSLKEDSGYGEWVNTIDWTINNDITIDDKIRIGYYYYDGYYPEREDILNGDVRFYLNGVEVYNKLVAGGGWYYFDLPNNHLEKGDRLTGTFRAYISHRFPFSLAVYVENFRIMGVVEDTIDNAVITQS